jgi:hypothetical protein
MQQHNNAFSNDLVTHKKAAPSIRPHCQKHWEKYGSHIRHPANAEQSISLRNQIDQVLYPKTSCLSHTKDV